jgi:hypothetical protein
MGAAYEEERRLTPYNGTKDFAVVRVLRDDDGNVALARQNTDIGRRRTARSRSRPS